MCTDHPLMIPLKGAPMTESNLSPPRRASITVAVGAITIGGSAPIAVQSMTNTDSADVQATVQQIEQLVNAGSELVRITVNTEEAAAAVPQIKERLAQRGVYVPLIGDFHFNGHRLLNKYPACAELLDKYRINPGNVGRGKKRDEQFATIVETACRYDKALRIGVNWGSLDQELVARLLDANAQALKPKPVPEIMREAVICSALESAAQAVEIGVRPERIILSVKMSAVPDLIAVYRQLATRCAYALHLGLTEAGMGSKGIVASTAALAVLLQEGIGDTIRISLTPEPGGDRTQEVQVAQELLQAMELRAFTPQVTACPGCGRTDSDYFQHLAQDIQTWLRQQMPVWRRKYVGVEQLKVAVMGCVVNGPGESKQADIGISLPGSGEIPVAPVYVDGAKAVTLKGANIAADFQNLVHDYVQRRYPAQT